MKRTIVAVVAALQIGVGILLLGGTAGIAGTAYRTVREESGQLADNLVAAAEALESARGTYAQSATNLFALTGTMDDVGGKLDAVSGKISRNGVATPDASFRKSETTSRPSQRRCEAREKPSNASATKDTGRRSF